MYRALAKKYQWTWEQIAGLTHYQIYWFLNEEENVDTMTFNTVEAYNEWLSLNRR